MVLLFGLLILFVRSPWGQDIIVTRVVSYVSDKTGTRVSIDKLYLTFSGNLSLKGLYLEDQQKDTLLYSKELEVSVALLPLIKGDRVNVRSVEWNGFEANIYRESENQQFNYDFLMESFAPKSESQPTNSAASGPEISIGRIFFENFDLRYADDLTGMKASLKLGELDLEVESFNLDKLSFEINELQINDTQIQYKLSKNGDTQTSSDLPTETSSLNLPTLSIGEFGLNNVSINYESVPDQTVAEADIGKLLLKLPMADVDEQKLRLDEFVLNDSRILLNQGTGWQGAPSDTSDVATQALDFEWPDWQIEAKQIGMNNNQIDFQTSDLVTPPGVFNPEKLSIQNLAFDAREISLKPGNAQLSLREFAFKEGSGFELQTLAFDLNIDDEQVSVDRIDLATQYNELSGNVMLKFKSLQQFLNAPDSSTIDVKLDKLKLGIEEVGFFNPTLVSNDYLTRLSGKELSGVIDARGQLNKIDISKIALRWGRQTSFDLSGEVNNVLDTDRLQVALKDVRAKTSQADLNQIMGGADFGFELPKKLTLNGSLTGGLKRVKTDMNLTTSDGSVSLKGQFLNQEQMAFQADLKATRLQLSKLLQNEQLDTLSFNMNLNGSGSSLNDLTAQLKLDFSRLKYDGYDFSKLAVEGQVKEGDGGIDLSFKDQNLDMTLKTLVELDSVSPKINTLFTVKGADLYELGLMSEDIRTAFELDVSFEGNASEFDLEAKVNDGVAVYERESYNFGSFEVAANSDPDTLNVRVNSQVMDSRIKANTSLEEVLPLIQEEFARYLGQVNEQADRLKSGNTKLEMRTVLRQAPILSEVFLQSLERMDTVSLTLDYNEQSREISAQLLAPYLQYQGSSLDSLNLGLEGTEDNLSFTAGWSSINSGPVSIDRASLAGTIKDSFIQSNLAVYDEAEKLLNIRSEVRLEADTVDLHIVPDSLIFNKKPWKVLASNQMTLANEFIRFQDFELSNGIQKVILGTSLPKQEKPHVGAIFENFQLATLTNLLNADKALATGMLKGDVIVENPFGSYGLLAELNIEDLSAFEVPFGVLDLEARSDGGEKYSVDLSVKGDNANLDLTGSYLASPSGADLTLDLDLKRLQMTVLEQFSGQSIAQSKGSLSASVEVSGKTNNPSYSGTVDFNGVGFLVNQLNTQFDIGQEQIKIDNSGLYLDDFVITDGDMNDFSLDGKVLTTELTNPNFDLQLKTNDFGLVNSTKQDNDLFYGQVNMDANLTIQGDLNIPKVRGSLKVNDASSLTFIVPESQLEIKARDGVVLFVNKKNPDDILTRVDQNESSAIADALSGYDIETVLSIGQNAQFNIVVDEATGDNLQVTGTGDFNLSLEPNGRTSLSGKYELSGGHYETNLYNLVKRKFEISPGSSISWSGDPYDAELKMKAIYNVKTSAGPLMAVRTSGEGTGLETAYQERLPFQVYINVDGVLLKPEISFNLEMPESGRSALGGAVYSQVQQLNSQEEELNKQVFSLLVLNRFFPSSGSDGSSGGPASLALDNVNKVLSGQLNNYSEKIFGKTGIDVGFDLNSTTASQNNNGQAQTQLGITAKKELFNDRLIVQVGSEVDVAGGQNSSQGTPIIGNVSLEYLLTQDRRLRLQGFSRNEYEGLIDGQLTVSGIALIFTREFNKFKELWAKQVKEEVDKQEKEKDKK